MGRSTPTVRTNRAFKEALQGSVAFNSGHTLWARYYFDRAVRRDATAGVNIGGFYRHKALFEQDMMQRRQEPSEATLRRDQERAFHYHGLAKHYYKRALPRHTHDQELLRLLSQEYQQLALLCESPRQAMHFTERADYYAQAAIDLSMDSQNQRRLATDLEGLTS